MSGRMGTISVARRSKLIVLGAIDRLGPEARLLFIIIGCQNRQRTHFFRWGQVSDLLVKKRGFVDEIPFNGRSNLSLVKK